MSSSKLKKVAKKLGVSSSALKRAGKIVSDAQKKRATSGSSDSSGSSGSSGSGGGMIQKGGTKTITPPSNVNVQSGGGNKSMGIQSAVNPLTTQEQVNARNLASAERYEQEQGKRASWDPRGPVKAVTPMGSGSPFGPGGVGNPYMSTTMNALMQGAGKTASQGGGQSGGGLGGGGGGSWGTNTSGFDSDVSILTGGIPGRDVTPQSEQSVIPGKTGNIITNYPEWSRSLVKDTAQSGIIDPIANYYGLGDREADYSLGSAFSAGIAMTALIPGVGSAAKVTYKGARGLTKLVTKYGIKKGKEIWSGLRKGGKFADDAAETLINKGDDVAESVSKKIGNSKPPTTKPPTTKPTVPRTGTGMSNLWRAIKIGMGTVATGTVGVGVYQGLTGANQAAESGTVRNAIPAGSTSGTPTETTPTGTTPTDTGKTPTQKTQQSATQSQMSATPASNVNTIGGGGSQIGGGNVGGSGSQGQTSVTGEQMTEEQAAAANMMRMPTDTGDGLGVTPPSEEEDLAGLIGARDTARSMLEQYGSQAITMPEYKQALQTLITSNLTNLNKIQPTPPEAVVETQEQVDFLNQFEDINEQFNVQSFMDETRRSLGMPEMEKAKIGLTKQLNAINQTYQSVIDDIKNNPNMPKGLAARRLTEIFEDQKFAVNQVLSELDLIEDQISNANQRLNVELGIFQDARSQAEKALERRVDQFGYIAESGAVAGLSDREIAQWSAVTGIPVEAIRQMKNNAIVSASEPDVEYSTRYEKDPNTGEMFMIVTNKNNPLDQPQVMSLGNFGATRTPKTTGVSGTDVDENILGEILAEVQDPRFVERYGDDKKAGITALANAYPEIEKIETLEEIYDNYIGEKNVEEETSVWQKLWGGVKGIFDR